jgi:hypothetical protein
LGAFPFEIVGAGTGTVVLFKRAAFSKVGAVPVLLTAGAGLAGGASLNGLPTGISQR